MSDFDLEPIVDPFNPLQQEKPVYAGQAVGWERDPLRDALERGEAYRLRVEALTRELGEARADFEQLAGWYTESIQRLVTALSLVAALTGALREIAAPKPGSPLRCRLCEGYDVPGLTHNTDALNCSLAAGVDGDKEGQT